jgi:ribosomal protein S18 acetylase RimI-like enzyme
MQISQNIIRTIEERSLNALPATHTLLLDGWVLRMAGGYTRRANSVQPLDAGFMPVAEKIQACEHIYRRQGLKVVFKLTPASSPAELDTRLDLAGYAFEAPTSLQVLDLTSRQPAGGEPEPETSSVGTCQSTKLEEDWLQAFFRMNHTAAETRSRVAQLLGMIVPETCFIGVRREGEIVGCGLGVCEAGFVGLYDIVADERFRRQGIGRQVVTSLLAWGQARAAHTAYLQVMEANPPALNLYAGLGFKELYRYWYRVKV